MFQINLNLMFMIMVDILVVGGCMEKLMFIFKYKICDDVFEYFWCLIGEGEDDVFILFEIIVGWEDVDVEFLCEVFNQVVQNYLGVLCVIFDVYVVELMGQCWGN